MIHEVPELFEREPTLIDALGYGVGGGGIGFLSVEEYFLALKNTRICHISATSALIIYSTHNILLALIWCLFRFLLVTLGFSIHSKAKEGKEAFFEEFFKVKVNEFCNRRDSSGFLPLSAVTSFASFYGLFESPGPFEEVRRGLSKHSHLSVCSFVRSFVRCCCCSSSQAEDWECPNRLS